MTFSCITLILTFLDLNVLQYSHPLALALEIRANQDTELIRWDYDVSDPPPPRQRTKRAEDMQPIAGRRRSSAASSPPTQAGCGTGCGCGSKWVYHVFISIFYFPFIVFDVYTVWDCFRAYAAGVPSERESSSAPQFLGDTIIHSSLSISGGCVTWFHICPCIEAEFKECKGARDEFLAARFLRVGTVVL